MKAAAANEAGAMTGFMGFGMAQQAGGAQAKDLFAMGQQNQQNTQVASQQATGGQPGIDSWTCPKCGNVASGKFCTECGGPKPEQGWQCTCGTVNQGKFCHNCGKAKPEGAPLYKCDKCGFEPKDPQNPPKFCPECGDPFDENDIL